MTLQTKSVAPDQASGRLKRAVEPAVVAVFVLAAAGLLLRLVLVARMKSPFMFYDELTGPAVARVLSGEGIQTFGVGSAPLYGVLLTPVEASTESGLVLYRGALLINAVLASLIGPTLYLFGRRALTLPPWTAAVGACIGGLTASTIGLSAMVIPEVLFTLTTVILCLVVHSFLLDPTGVRNRLALLSGMALFLSAHPRSVVAVAAILLTLAYLAVTRTITLRSAGTTGSLVVALWLGVSVLTSRLAGAAFVEGSPEAAGIGVVLRTALENPDLLVRSAIGTSFYLAASTAGVVGVGVAAILWCGSQTVRLRDSRPPIDVFIGLFLAGTLALSVMYVPWVTVASPARPDVFAYGRYVEHTLPILLMYAVAGWGILRIKLTGMAVGTSAITAGGLLAARSYDDQFWFAPTAHQNWTGLHWYRSIEGTIDPSKVWTLALITAIVLLVASSIPKVKIGALLLVAGIGVLSGSNFVTKWASRTAQPAPLVAEIATVEDLEIGVPVVEIGPIRAQLIEFWAPEANLTAYLQELPSNSEAILLRWETTPPEGATELLGDEASNLRLWLLAEEPSSTGGS